MPQKLELSTESFQKFMIPNRAHFIKKQIQFRTDNYRVIQTGRAGSGGNVH
jgi:hypothetical protein